MWSQRPQNPLLGTDRVTPGNPIRLDSPEEWATQRNSPTGAGMYSMLLCSRFVCLCAGKATYYAATWGPGEEKRPLGEQGPAQAWALSSSHIIHDVLTLVWMATQGARAPTWTCRSSNQSTDMGGTERVEGALDGLQEAAGDCVQQRLSEGPL